MYVQPLASYIQRVIFIGPAITHSSLERFEPTSLTALRL